MAMTATSDAQTERLPELVYGPESPLADIVRTCLRVARSDATILLSGETGTGKEVFAKTIHLNSPRAHKPLVAVNCGAIPEALLESELFGHVRGAFTGAATSRRGRIAAAEGGTLFLDEIGELSLSLQVKLLRVLQEHAYEPVGSSEPVTADFRLVAATNRDLAAEVAAGRFRRDLYYRLFVCPIEIPPLRTRTGDVLRLFTHFWTRRGERRPVEPAVTELLRTYEWPGNVRELENLVERLSVCSEGNTIRVADLPLALRKRHVSVAPPPPEPETAADGPAPTPVPLAEIAAPRAVEAAPDAAEPAPAPAADEDVRALLTADGLHLPEPCFAGGRPVDLPSILRRLENEYIASALVYTGGNKKAAADLLGLQRTTLVEKLRRRNREASGS